MRCTASLNGHRALSVFLLLGGIVHSEPSLAVELRTGREVIVQQGEVVDDDLYLFGETITINGTVMGDVLANGRQVTLNGSIEGDLTGCAQAVRINGRVGDDLRVAGMVIQLGPESRIGDDILTASFDLQGEPGSTAGGALIFAGYQARMAGSIGKDLIGEAVGVELLGTVGGDMRVGVDSQAGRPLFVKFLPSPIAIAEVPPGLTVADAARISGKLTYRSAEEGQIASAAQIDGGVLREEPTVDSMGTWQSWLIRKIRRLIALIVVGLLLTWVTPTFLRSLEQGLEGNPLPKMGWGAVALVAVVAAVVVVPLVMGLLALLAGLLTGWDLLVPVLGVGVLTEALLVTDTWVAAALIAPVVVGSALGRWLLKRTLPSRADGRILPLVVGLVSLVGLSSVPYLGSLVAVVVLLLGLGLVCLWAVGVARTGTRKAAPAT